MGPKCSASPHYCIPASTMYEWHRVAWHHPVNASLPVQWATVAGAHLKHGVASSLHLRLSIGTWLRTPLKSSTGSRRFIPAGPMALACPASSRQSLTVYPISTKLHTHGRLTRGILSPLHLRQSNHTRLRALLKQNGNIWSLYSRGIGFLGGTPSKPYSLSNGHRVALSRLKHGVTLPLRVRLSNGTKFAHAHPSNHVII